MLIEILRSAAVQSAPERRNYRSVEMRTASHTDDICAMQTTGQA